MSYIAEFRLASPDLPLSSALNAARDVTLRVEQAIAEDPSRPVLFLWATGTGLDLFDRAVETDPTVDEVTTMEDAGDRRLYRISVAADAEIVMYPMDVELGVSRLSVRATCEGLDVRMRFPSREAVGRYREACEEMGVTFSLRRLYAGEGTDASAAEGTYGLSKKQRETLVRAVDSGFYDVPRGTGLTTIADDLGVSEQAISERLRRGTALLVRTAFGTD